MVDVTKFETYLDLKNYKIQLAKKIFKLENDTLWHKHMLIGEWSGEEKAKIRADETIVDKDSACKYIDYLKRLWRKSLPEYLELRSLKTELEELDRKFPTDQYGGRNFLNEYRDRTNAEWLEVITYLMNQRSERHYSIQFFDRNISVIGVGTHSDSPKYSNTEKMTHIVIVADDFDMESVHNFDLSWPEEHPETYKNYDFILYDNNVFYSKSEYLKQKSRGLYTYEFC